jgi:hypothetical protein
MSVKVVRGGAGNDHVLEDEPPCSTEQGTPIGATEARVEHATGLSASQISDCFRRGAGLGGSRSGLKVPARRDPGDRDGHAVNEQGPAYLR